MTLNLNIFFFSERSRVLLSEPGEIRAEYQAELKRLQEERLQLEQKQLQESTALIKLVNLSNYQQFRSVILRIILVIIN